MRRRTASKEDDPQRSDGRDNNNETEGKLQGDGLQDFAPFCVPTFLPAFVLHVCAAVGGRRGSFLSSKRLRLPRSCSTKPRSRTCVQSTKKITTVMSKRSNVHVEFSVHPLRSLPDTDPQGSAKGRKRAAQCRKRKRSESLPTKMDYGAPTHHVLLVTNRNRGDDDDGDGDFIDVVGDIDSTHAKAYNAPAAPNAPQRIDGDAAATDWKDKIDDLVAQLAKVPVEHLALALVNERQHVYRLQAQLDSLAQSAK